MMSGIAEALPEPLTGFFAFLVAGAVVSGAGLYVLWDGEQAKHRLAYFHLASVLGIWSVVSGTALTAPAADDAHFWATVSCVLTLLVITLAYRFAVHALDVERERRPVIRILASVAAVAVFFALTGQLDVVQLVPEAGGVGAAVGQALEAGSELVPHLRWQAALVAVGVLAGLGGALHMTWREWRSDHAGLRGREAAWIALGLVATAGVLLQYVPTEGLVEFPIGTVAGAVGLVVLARAARGESPPPTGVAALSDAILDAAWGPMVVCERDGTIRGVSEPFALEYGHDELLEGTKLQSLLAEPGSDALTLRRLLVTGSTGGELPLVHLKTGEGDVLLTRVEAARLGRVEGEPAGVVVLFQEASRKKAARSLDRFDRLYRDPRRGSPVCVAIAMQREGRLLEANDELLDLTGHLREEILGRPLDEYGVSVEGGWSALARPAPRGKWTGESVKTTFRTSSGRTREAEIHTSRVRLGAEDCLLMLVHEVGTRRSRGSFSRSRLLYDPLTGLPNQSLFENRIGHALKRARSEGAGVGVLLVALDGIDEVVETRGRAAADQTLRVVGQRLGSSFRELDTVSYLGDRRFGVLLEDLEDPEAAVAAGTRFRESLDDPLEVWGWTVELSARIGIAVSSDGGGAHDVETLVRGARQALKRAGQPDESDVVRIRDPVSAAASDETSGDSEDSTDPAESSIVERDDLVEEMYAHDRAHDRTEK